jgi:hypothetical protein
MKRQKIDFATTLNETQSYIGELAIPYVTEAFTKNKTVDSGVRIVEDIVKYEYVAKLSGSGLVQTGQSCDFNPDGTITATEVKLAPCTFHIDIELCYKDLEALWNGISSGNLNTQDAGADFQSALQKVLIDAMHVDFEDKLWNFTGSTTGCSITGLTGQITNIVSGVTGLTSGNIVAAVDALTLALPNNILEDVTGLKIYMNPKTALKYKQALMKLGLNTPADMPPQTYGGLSIYVISQIKDNVMVAIQPQNIVVGVGAADNFTQLIIKDMRESTLDNKVRMKIQGNADFKVIYPAEAAMWKF